MAGVPSLLLPVPRFTCLLISSFPAVNKFSLPLVVRMWTLLSWGI